jgi:hypothetical protein
LAELECRKYEDQEAVNKAQIEAEKSSQRSSGSGPENRRIHKAKCQSHVVVGICHFCGSFIGRFDPNSDFDEMALSKTRFSSFLQFY